MTAVEDDDWIDRAFDLLTTVPACKSLGSLDGSGPQITKDEAILMGRDAFRAMLEAPAKTQ